jgi:hypothetical protein
VEVIGGSAAFKKVSGFCPAYFKDQTAHCERRVKLPTKHVHDLQSLVGRGVGNRHNRLLATRLAFFVAQCSLRAFAQKVVRELLVSVCGSSLARRF